MRPWPLLLALAGCSPGSPQYESRVWEPVGANDANLAAMVVNPLDLVNGVPSPGADGVIAAAAVARYRAGKVKALPDTGLAQITLTGGGGGGGAAPTAAAPE